MAKTIHIPNVSIDERIGSAFNFLFHIINDTESSSDEIIEWDFSGTSFFSSVLPWSIGYIQAQVQQENSLQKLSFKYA